MVAETTTPSALQLADDPLIAPPRILPGKPHNQCANVRWDRWSTGWSRIGPALGDQAPVPPEERRRRDDKHRPVDAGQQPACCRQEHPVGGPKRGTPDLPAKHCYLVSEDDDLEVLRPGRPEPQEEQLQDALERDVKNRQNHGTSDDTTRGPLFYRDRINASHTL